MKSGMDLKSSSLKPTPKSGMVFELRSLNPGSVLHLLMRVSSSGFIGLAFGFQVCLTSLLWSCGGFTCIARAGPT